MDKSDQGLPRAITPIAWALINAFDREYRRCEDRKEDIQILAAREELPSAKRYLIEVYALVFGKAAPAVPPLLIKSAITYELQFRGFQAAGCEEYLTEDFRQNRAAALAFDVTAHTPRMRQLTTLLIEGGQTQAQQTPVRKALNTGKAFRLVDYADKRDGHWVCKGSGCGFTSRLQVACAMVAHVKSCGRISDVANQERSNDTPSNAAADPDVPRGKGRVRTEKSTPKSGRARARKSGPAVPTTKAGRVPKRSDVGRVPQRSDSGRGPNRDGDTKSRGAIKQSRVATKRVRR